MSRPHTHVPVGQRQYLPDHHTTPCPTRLASPRLASQAKPTLSPPCLGLTVPELAYPTTLLSEMRLKRNFFLAIS